MHEGPVGSQYGRSHHSLRLSKDDYTLSNPPMNWMKRKSSRKSRNCQETPRPRSVLQRCTQRLRTMYKTYSPPPPNHLTDRRSAWASPAPTHFCLVLPYPGTAYQLG